MQDCSTDQDQLRTQGNFGKKKKKNLLGNPRKQA